MALSVFPTLDGLEWNTTKRPEFKTGLFESLSGHESRVKFRQYPKYTFKLSFEFLIEDRDEAQLSELMGFMLQQGGMYQAFLYSDPNDNAVTDQLIGTGNGTLTTFQLLRSYGGFTEPVNNVNDTVAAPGIYIDGALKTLGAHYSLSSTGLVTFGTAPGTGAVITWTGSYYYRVRFTEEGYEFTQLMRDLHECQDVEFIGSVRNVV